MKKLIPVIFTLAAVTPFSSAQADDSWYIGAQYNMQDISLGGRDYNAAGAIAGYQFNEFFAIETRISTGTSGVSRAYDTPQVPLGNYSEDIDLQTSLSIKVSYPIYNSLNLYGLIGYTNTKIEINGLASINDSENNIIGSTPFKSDESEGGLSFGIGVNYQFNENVGIFVDYKVLPDFEPNSNISESWRSTTVGVTYAF